MEVYLLVRVGQRGTSAGVCGLATTHLATGLDPGRAVIVLAADSGKPCGFCESDDYDQRLQSEASCSAIHSDISARAESAMRIHLDESPLEKGLCSGERG